MKVLVGVGGSSMLLAGLYTGDALTSGEVYDLPLEQAYSELSAMTVPAELMQAGTGIYAPAVAVREAFPVIDWQFRVRGRDVATFTARLSPAGPGRTRVRVEYTPGEPSTAALGHFTSANLVREMARLAMSEQVDALLERRPVDRDAIADAFARHAAAHPEQMREFEQAMGEMVADLHRQANETSREAAPAHSGTDWPTEAEIRSPAAATTIP